MCDWGATPQNSQSKKETIFEHGVATSSRKTGLSVSETASLFAQELMVTEN